MLKSAHFAFALSLLLLGPEASAGFAPHASFSHGFSSHASSSHASVPHAAPAKAPSGSFGSFGRSAAQAQPQKSNSALSQQLSRDASQARALQTLDQRNAAKAAQSAPQPASAPAPAPAPTTVIVHQDGGGLGHVVAGAMLARSMNAHAHGGYYPTPGYNGAPATAPSSGGSSVFGTLMTLCLLALIAWGLWFAWRGMRRRRAARREADKPNYSFERN